MYAFYFGYQISHKSVNLQVVHFFSSQGRKEKTSMMLRSSSTPVLGSLLSSFADSPSNETTHIVKHLPPLPATSVPHHHNNNKLSLYQTQTGSLTLSCNSSPISPSISDKGFRRAQSEGNLEGLAYAHAHAASSCNKSSVLTLETIPSFSFANHNKSLREEDDEEEDEESDEFQEEGRVKSMLVTEKMRVEKGTCSVDYYGEQEEMKYVSMMGLGFEACGDGMGGNGGDYNNSMGSGSSGGDDGERSQEVEEYYKKMVEENPRNPLVLRNYAQFLHQVHYHSSN